MAEKLQSLTGRQSRERPSYYYSVCSMLLSLKLLQSQISYTAFGLYELFEVSKLKIVFFQFMGKLTCSHMQDISTQHHNGITLFSVYFLNAVCLNGPAVCFCGWLTKLLLKL